MDGEISNGIKQESVFKIISKWASLTKDMLSSIKDCGVIVFVFLVIFFREPVLGFLTSRGVPPSSVNLFGIQMSLDSLQFAGEAQQLSALVKESESPAPSIEKAITAVEQSAPKITAVETRLLKSPEAAVIGDWAIVVAGQPSLELAKSETSRMHFGPLLQTKIFKKRDYYRLVVQVGTRDAVESALTESRKSFPDAYLVSLSRWCGSVTASDEYISCSAT